MTASALQSVAVLGATGSIGRSTLDVLSQHPDKYRLFAVTASRSRELLLDICVRFKPVFAVLREESDAQWLRQSLNAYGAQSTEVLFGEAALAMVASDDQVDVVMSAIMGAAGLLPTLAAVKAGKRVLLANKEALVMSGALFMDAVKTHGATLLPIDSEHNAIYQCLPLEHQQGPESIGVDRLLLTASGGPFRGWSAQSLRDVTPEQACAHPNWSMGQKISVDSATLMNKGLELIEACWLFNAKPSQIEVVVHPQSIIHSMVSYVDGTVLAQMGNPDMRTPISYGLAWPQRMSSGVSPLNLFDIARLDFEQPNDKAFPALRLVREAMDAGGTAPAILNAANEIAVEAFLQRRIGFPKIAEIVDAVLDQSSFGEAHSLEQILLADQLARDAALDLIASLSLKRLTS